MSSTSTPKSSLANNNIAAEPDSLQNLNMGYTNPVPITPMPKFDDLDTPEIHRRAQRYGLKKNIGKKKLKTKLEEVYLYTHQTYSPSHPESNGFSSSNAFYGEAISRPSPLAAESCSTQKNGNSPIHTTPIKPNISNSDETNRFSKHELVQKGVNKLPKLSDNGVSDEISSPVAPVVFQASPESPIFIEHDLADNSIASAIDMSGVVIMDVDAEYASHSPSCHASPTAISGSNSSTPIKTNTEPAVISLLDSPKENALKMEEFVENSGCIDCSVAAISPLYCSHDCSEKVQKDAMKLGRQFMEEKISTVECIDLTASETSYNAGTSHSVSDIFADLTPVAVTHELETSKTTIVEGNGKGSSWKEIQVRNSRSSVQDNVSETLLTDHNENKEYCSSDMAILKSAANEGRQAGLETVPVGEEISENEYEEREKFHQSLFKSFNCSSSSDSSSEEHSEEECVSLFERVSKKIEDGGVIKTKLHHNDQTTASRNEPDAREIPATDILPQTKSQDSTCELGTGVITCVSLPKKPRKRSNQEIPNNVPEMFEPASVSEPKKLKLTKEELELEMCNAIRAHDELHTSILLYKPIYLSQFKTVMKNYGLRVSLDDLRDFLDSKGITFSTADENRSKGPRVVKKKFKKKS